MKRKLLIWTAAVVCVAAVVVGCIYIVGMFSGRENSEEQVAEPTLLYGIDIDNYRVESGVIASGETLSVIFERYGVPASVTHKVEQCAEPVFKLNNIRATHPYTVFLSNDSLSRLCHFVYEKNITEYITFSLENDSIAVRADQKDVIVKRCTGRGVITSSLWNCMIDNGMTPALAMDLSDIFAWSIDFFGIREGDSFEVIYDEKYVDTTRIGVGTIYGAWFDHMGKRYYAIPFRQDGRLSYWDKEGNSLRKQLLKAPLKFSRISSRFTNARRHPVLKIVRPHHGVDYAAAAGTPVHAVADGVVTFKGWSGGGGNTIKIRHARQLQTSYMHLRGFAKGISNGSRVSQGQLIGYVGSTGLSTGPHLDFRLYRNGTPIDPLKAPSEPSEPIKKANKPQFESIRDRVLAELDGDAPDSLKITLHDLE